MRLSDFCGLQVIVPITVLAVYHAFAYCAKNFPNNRLWRKFGVRAHSVLASRQVLNHGLSLLWVMHGML